MATISGNLKMTLPESFDKVDVSVLSNNFALIDAFFDKFVQKEAIANNLTTTEAGKILDAQQGRELATRIATVSGEKMNKTDIVNNLETNDGTKPLSAAQGLILNTLLSKKVEMKMAAVTLPAANWSANQQTVSVLGVTEEESAMAVIVRPAPSCHEYYGECDVRCAAQGENILIFECAITPTSDLTANVLILQ